jgi:hypothetical protein
VADKETESSAARADVNRHLRMAVERFDAPGSEEETWDFLCECGFAGCKEWVTLPLWQYEELRRTGIAVLAPGHKLKRGERSRRKALHLVDDTKALHAQAEHRLRRAVSNLRKTADDSR